MVGEQHRGAYGDDAHLGGKLFVDLGHFGPLQRFDGGQRVFGFQVHHRIGEGFACAILHLHLHRGRQHGDCRSAEEGGQAEKVAHGREGAKQRSVDRY